MSHTIFHANCKCHPIPTPAAKPAVVPQTTKAKHLLEIAGFTKSGSTEAGHFYTLHLDDGRVLVAGTGWDDSWGCEVWPDAASMEAGKFYPHGWAIQDCQSPDELLKTLIAYGLVPAPAMQPRIPCGRIHCNSWDAVANWIGRLRTKGCNYFVPYLDVKGPSICYGLAVWAVPTFYFSGGTPVDYILANRNR